MDDFPFFLTDAVHWPSTARVIQDYDYTSDDGYTTKTGTAITTFNRITLDDVLPGGKVAFGPNGVDPSLVGKNQFLAVQSAIGRQPGWIAIFGGYDPIVDAFTTTVNHPPDDVDGDGNPIPPDVTHTDGGLGLDMICNQLAPGRQSFVTDVGENTDSYLIGINNVQFASDAAEVTVAYEMEQIYEGYAGDAKQPPIPPIFQFTLPDDFAFLSSIRIFYNGVKSEFRIVFGSNFSTNVLAIIFQFAPIVSGGTFPALKTEVRGSYKIDVQAKHFGDVLSGDTVSYFAMNPGDAATLHAGALVQAIDDPFHLTGQSFSSDRDENGLKITVEFT